MTDVAVIAVDGGASKTHLALVGAEGQLLTLVRGPESSPQNLGLAEALDVLDELFASSTRELGLEAAGHPLAQVAQLMMSGVDFPSEEQELREAIESRAWAKRTIVDNDTFAVLRAGTERGWGVAVVCGSGINCVGVSADGRHARFPALGEITGDWGGGSDVGRAALYAAARGQDGRGPHTTLERAVPVHFGFQAPDELAEAIHRERIPPRRLRELPPVVFAEAEHDAVAAEIVERLASEIVAMARVALERLDLHGESAEVLLGGGLLQSGDGRLTSVVEAELRSLAPEVSVTATSSPPIVGAALLGLDAVGAPAEAQRRMREELEAAVEAEAAGGGASDG
jgi:N-acetylglucosamine kinase-like BadF-type ATPase